MKQIIMLLLVLSSGAAHADYISCLAAVGQDKKYIPLREKMPLLETKSQRTHEKGSETYSSNDEQRLIQLWSHERRDCISSNKTELSKLPDSLTRLLFRLQDRIEEATAHLWAENITYRSFAKELDAALGQYNKDFSRLKAEYERDPEQ